MKKLALALVVSAVTLSATESKQLTSGFYLGLNAGVGATTSKFSSTNSDAPFADAAGSIDMGNTNANLGIYGGYGWIQNCLYIGGEVGYTFSNEKIRSSYQTLAGFGNMELKRNGYGLVALRGGYLYTPSTMLYLRLAGHWGKWSLRDTLNGGFNLNNPGTGSKNRFSFAPGVGLETAVHKNVYLRVEYNYEFGPSVRATNPNHATVAARRAFSNMSSIRSQSGKIGLAYKF